MAHIDCSFYSDRLLKNVHVVVYLPTVSADDMLEDRPVDYFEPGRRFPVLYLLHGMYGDCLDWPLKSRIEDYAQERGVAVVMPSAENSFYMDMEHGEDYLGYIGEELPEFMCKMFPVSRDREQTFIAGLSMGGYGAYRIGLAYPDRFGWIASLSGALIAARFLTGNASHIAHLPLSYKKAITDDILSFAGTENDLLYLARTLKEKTPEKMPRMYMTVGTEDFIYPLNEQFYSEMQKAGLDIQWETWPGEHNWNFWDAHIQDVLKWLPLQ